MTVQQFTEIILKMSLTGSVVFLIVLPIRFVVGKFSKSCVCILWMAVLFRLLVPFSFRFILSPLNFFTLWSGEPLISETVSPNFPLAETRPFSPVFIILFYVWMAGAVVVVIYHVSSYCRVRKSIRGAMKIRDNVYMADYINTAFVFGTLNPKIYIPSKADTKDCHYMILHEKNHIKRADHIVKLLIKIAVIVHWFNPITWIMSALLSKDIELSCDEKVLKEIGPLHAAEYATTVLKWSTNRRLLPDNGPELGGGYLKSRIKHIGTYKIHKKSVLIIVASLCLLFVCACSTNAVNKTEKNNISTQEQVVEINGTNVTFQDGISLEDLDSSFMRFIENHETKREFWVQGNGTLWIKEPGEKNWKKKGD